jgi:hypothetical protein
MKLLDAFGQLLLLVLSPLLLLVCAATFAAVDLAWLVTGRRKATPDPVPAKGAATIVIPTWNGRDLLARFLPGVIRAAASRPGTERTARLSFYVKGSAA